MKLKRIIDRYLLKLFKKKDKEEPWLAYYSEEDKSIKFTNKSIYEYMLSTIGQDLDFYALNYFGTRITYDEMFKRINLIARSLKHLGVKKGDIVTICMPNMPEAIETFYAINKIGAIADMIHPLSGAAEIKHYLAESKSRIMLLYDGTYEKVKGFIEDTSVYRTILVSAGESMPSLLKFGYKITKEIKIKKPNRWDNAFISWQEFLNMGHLYHGSIDTKVNTKDLAIILHSGGTTGTPKGIMISNYNFNALAQQCAICVGNVKPKDKIMTILPIFHGFGLGVCLHVPLCLKMEAILIPEFDAKRFPKTISKYKPNVIAGVPTLWEAMLSNPNFDGVDLSSLKYIISGGDNLTITMENKMNRFLRMHGANIKMTKGYGMTESVAVTAYTIEGANEPGSIGIPLVENSFCICTPETIDELPYGEEGEICVNGPSVMMGYFNNKEETEKVLKKHADGKIWLHTGDIGYIAPNGVIYFTQRLKRMIVSSGFNIYPSAIEEVIEKHDLVKRCCVIGIPHPYKMSVAKAFVVLNDGVEPNAKIKAEIRLLCKEHLAVYSQPKEIEFRNSLPKTLYNKVDYKILESEEKEKRVD